MRGLHVEELQCEGQAGAGRLGSVSIWSDGGGHGRGWLLLPTLPSSGEEFVSLSLCPHKAGCKLLSWEAVGQVGLGCPLSASSPLSPRSFFNFLRKTPSKVQGAITQNLNS